MISNRKRIRNNSKQLPDLELRNAGGIYAQMAKSKIKPDPLKAQVDFLYSNCIQSQGTVYPFTGGMTERLDRDSIQRNDLLQTVKREFVKRTIPHRLNPITHGSVKEFADHNKQKERPNTDAFNILDPQKEKVENQSEVSAQKQELKK